MKDTTTNTPWTPGQIDRGSVSIYAAPDGNLGGGFLYAAPDPYLPNVIAAYAIPTPECLPKGLPWPTGSFPRSDTEPEIRALLTEILERLDRMEKLSNPKQR